MADESSSRGGRLPVAALLALFLLTLSAGHLHVCSGEATQEAATAPLGASGPGPAASPADTASAAARVVISESPSNTGAGAGASDAAAGEVQSSAPPSVPPRAPPAASAATPLPASAAPRPARSVPPSVGHAPPELELESAADADHHLETNEVGVGNTAGRYFHGIRPTRPVDASGADGGGSVHVTGTAGAAPGAGTGTGTGTGEPSGEEQGASRAGGRGPPLSPTATASSAATAREEEEEEEADKQQEKHQEKLEEEERLVKKIWSIAQGDGSAPATPQKAGGETELERARGRARALGDEASARGEAAFAPSSSAAAAANATGRSEERKTNPDIQDIITGIVKLLNGNVKVQANTNLGGPVAPGARPPRPMGTRINNRGPPRITDLPPLPPLDLDAPPPPPAPGAAPGPGATASTRLPPPYPFDRPMGGAQPGPGPGSGPGPALPPQPPGHAPNAHPFVNGVPLPEQVVPVANQRPPPPPRPRPPPQRPRPPPSRRPPPPGLPPQPPPHPQQPPPPPPQARPPPDEVPVIPVTFHAFELLPSTGAGDMPPPPAPPPDTAPDDDGDEAGTADADLEAPPAEDDAAGQTAQAEAEAEPEPAAPLPEATQGEVPTTPPPPPPAPPSSPPPTPPPTPPPSPPPSPPSAPPTSPPTSPPPPPPPPAPQPKPEKDVKKPLDSSKEKEVPPKAQPTRGGIASRPTLAPAAPTPANTSTSEGPETNVMGGAPVPPTHIRPTPTTAADGATAATERPADAFATSPAPSSERPILLEPSTGVGVAEPVLESSMQEEGAGGAAPGGPALSPAAASPAAPTAALPAPGYSYRPRPGLVLDDPEYKPAGGSRPLGMGLGLGLGLGLGAPPPIVTAPAGRPGEVFDVTVSAVQGPDGGGGGGGPALHTGRPFVYPVELPGPPGAQGSGEVITSPQRGQHFVSIDGKRTYINLMGQPTARPGGVHATRPLPPGATAPPTRPAGPPAHAPDPASPAQPAQAAQPAAAPPGSPGSAGVGVGVGASAPASPARPPPYGGPRRPAPPAQPPVRIDTCIVGDASTCDEAQHERCRTEHGVSACHCRPGYSRRKHREPCRRIVSMLMSLRVDRLYERRVVWSSDLQDPSSEMYQQLQWEASRAVDSAMSMTPFSDDFLGARVNGVYAAPGTAAPVFVNLTLQLEETAETLRPAVRHDVQRHLLGVIHRRANNVGESALWVDAPAGAVSHLQDVDECARPELHDCHPRAVCSNVFGGFRCACAEGLRDPWADQPARAGRACEPCPPEHCGGPARGACHYDAQGQPVCTCTGNFYGAQCEVDGEVLGVAVGASVAAVVIIALTLVCLCMWSRRWQREQKAAVGSPVFGYLGAAGGTVKTPAVGGPPYQVSLEDRLRWAQIADVMAQANHYSTPLACQQPEPGGTVPTRPSSAVFGYPALPAALTATLPPAPLPRLGLHGLLPPPPAPQGAPPPPPAPSTRAGSGARTIDNCSSGDDEDRADLLGGRSFHVPRPKSRSSVANQSGIYYDVDYDQSDIYGTKHPSIPMNTYASRGSYHRQ